jgi:hypothetical protein
VKERSNGRLVFMALLRAYGDACIGQNPTAIGLGWMAVIDMYDALAAMPEPGCEGCKYESMEVFGCRDCARRMRDHYTPKEAGK